MTTKGLDFSLETYTSGEDLLGGNIKYTRLLWLRQMIQPGDIYFLQDGELSKAIFKEITESYINGQFIAVITLGFAFIEKTIAGRIFFTENKNSREKSELLLKKALSKNWISEEEHGELNSIREIRNSLIHFREKHGQSFILEKSYANLDYGAKIVILSIIRMLNKTSI